MRLEQAIDAAIERGRGVAAYLGIVTAIDSALGSLTVDLGADTGVPGVRWVAPYAPAVGDLVVVLRVGGTGWWVMGKNSYDAAHGTRLVRGEITVTPAASYTGIGEDSWSWAPTDTTTGLGQGRNAQGRVVAGVSVMPPLASLLPAGVIVTSAKIRVLRLPVAGSAGAPLVGPSFYGHASSTQPPGAPAWSTTVWVPGQVIQGQSAQWDLPSAWLTALLAGTMQGVGVGATSAATFSAWSPPAITLTYTTPA